MRVEPIPRVEAVYWQAWQDINRHYARRARLNELKTLKNMGGNNELEALPEESRNDCKQGAEL